ncbi:expressed unknown protein [Seminavis robusta]|uniref:Uncharacterized protein n=1 Tax=Seminavis robusta TaxID=568900 RepID=A0A9N8H7F3_9STRA|nr:expressed unknown protein [Seminavis robusta]|eukprot:Sro139_g065170.1 n/a (655) ;mRNA; f:84411-86375
MEGAADLLTKMANEVEEMEEINDESATSHVENQLEHLENLLAQAETEGLLEQKESDGSGEDTELGGRQLDAIITKADSGGFGELLGGSTPTNILDITTTDNILDLLGFHDNSKKKKKTFSWKEQDLLRGIEPTIVEEQDGLEEEKQESEFDQDPVAVLEADDTVMMQPIKEQDPEPVAVSESEVSVQSTVVPGSEPEASTEETTITEAGSPELVTEKKDVREDHPEETEEVPEAQKDTQICDEELSEDAAKTEVEVQDERKDDHPEDEALQDAPKYTEQCNKEGFVDAPIDEEEDEAVAVPMPENKEEKQDGPKENTDAQKDNEASQVENPTDADHEEKNEEDSSGKTITTEDNQEPDSNEDMEMVETQVNAPVSASEQTGANVEEADSPLVVKEGDVAEVKGVAETEEKEPLVLEVRKGSGSTSKDAIEVRIEKEQAPRVGAFVASSTSSAEQEIAAAASDTMLFQSGRLLMELKNEVQKLRNDYDRVQANNKRLAEANVSSGASFESLNHHAELLQKKLDESQTQATAAHAALTGAKTAVAEVRVELKLKKAAYVVEVQNRLAYQKALQQVADLVQNECKDSALVEKILALVEKTEAESMAVPALKDTEETNSVAASVSGEKDEAHPFDDKSGQGQDQGYYMSYIKACVWST